MKPIYIAVLACALLLPGVSLSADLRPFDRMDVFELEWVSNPQISPDGKRIVYVRNSMDIMADGKSAEPTDH